MKSKKETESPINKLTRIHPGAEAVIHVVLGLFTLACLIPFIFVVIISFSSVESIRTNGYSFFPSAVNLEAYDAVLKVGRQLWDSLFNSFFITIVGTVASTAICVLYAYPLYRRDYKYRTLFTWLSFFTMIFGGGLAPTMIIARSLGLDNNYAALIIPLLVSPFNFIIMRSFFQSSVPTELLEAASIDGCGEWRALLKIVLPISKPGIATIALLNMITYWNDWYLAQLFINNTNNKLFPLQYLLVKIQRDASNAGKYAGLPGAEIKLLPTESLRMALCVVIVIPIAFAYPFFQRYIVAGLTVGAVKG